MSLTTYRHLLLAGTIAAIIVTIVGGVVRITGSGLGCPDWPLCHGQIIPPWRFDAWMEFSHRVAAGMTGILIMVLSVIAWTKRRDDDLLTWVPALLMPVLLIPQSILGAVIVWLELPADASPGVMLHLGIALIIIACMLVPFVALLVGQQQQSSPTPTDPTIDQHARRYRTFVFGTTLASWLLILTGGMVAGYHAIFSCIGFPECNGALIPLEGGIGVLIQMIHRITAAVVSILLIMVIWKTWTIRSKNPSLFRTAIVAGVLLTAQIVVAAIIVLLWFPSSLALFRTLHLAFATGLWCTMVALSVQAYRRPSVVLAAIPQASTSPSSRPSPIADFLSLTKPRVVLLLLLTTVATMYITGEGHPPAALVFWTVLGGYLAAGGAGAINCALEGDIDRLMGRTGRRPVPSGRIAAHHAMWFGIVLSVLAILVLGFFTNWLAAFLALIGIIYYILIYTIWLKRTTWLNIVIGGAAGAIPPLVGWAAMTGTLSLTPFILFVIIFYWTPPHFWALALVRKDDYARAGIPMLPVVRSSEHTRWQMLLYSILMVMLTFILTPLQAMGPLYLVLALLFGAIFLGYAWNAWRTGEQTHIWGLYRYSLLYLALLFSAMVLDRVLLA